MAWYIFALQAVLFAYVLVALLIPVLRLDFSSPTTTTTQTPNAVEEEVSFVPLVVIALISVLVFIAVYRFAHKVDFSRKISSHENATSGG